MMAGPVTERPNPLTTNIDIASPRDIVHLLELCDAEIFGGYENSEGLLDKRIVSALDDLSSLAATILQSPDDNLILFSGAGMSGRIGFMTARTFGRQLTGLGKKNCFQYMIAGGDKTLLASQELYEDDPIHGAHTLKQVCKGKKRVLYFGITCGLSAPYVAGQLDYCLQNPQTFTPVLLGFNPVSQARNRKIEKWDKTFLQVAQRMEEASRAGKAFLLNPIIGPEPIAGSSRMKGGSATKILVDVICMCAQQRAFSPDPGVSNVCDYISQYKTAIECVYREGHDISQLVQAGGQSLTSGGHIYYLGRDTCGILGFVDASECRPTFGAVLEDVRGFLEGGFDSLGNKEGDISHLGEDCRISVSHFYTTIFPSVTEKDTIIYCNPDEECLPPSPALTAVIRTLTETDPIKEKPNGVDFSVNIRMPVSVSTSAQELAVKLVYNSVSTGSHIIKGKVLNNLMVDVKISNNKLYHRGIGIIQTFGKCSVAEAEVYLLRSIYSTDHLTSDQLSADITSHIQKACPQPKIVPLALLLAMDGCTVDEAKQRQACNPVIRTALLQATS